MKRLSPSTLMTTNTLEAIGDLMKRARIHDIKLNERETKEFLTDFKNVDTFEESSIFFEDGFAEVKTKSNKTILFELNQFIDRPGYFLWYLLLLCELENFWF